LQYPDWRQVLGYFLALTGSPEIALISVLRNKPLLWLMLASLLLAASSIVWSAALVWVVARFRKPTSP
jgi:hypothetical protein